MLTDSTIMLTIHEICSTIITVAGEAAAAAGGNTKALETRR